MIDFSISTVMKMKEYDRYKPKCLIVLRARYPQNLPHFICDVAKLPQGCATLSAERHAVTVMRNTLGTACPDGTSGPECKRFERPDQRVAKPGRAVSPYGESPCRSFLPERNCGTAATWFQRSAVISTYAKHVVRFALRRKSFPAERTY